MDNRFTTLVELMTIFLFFLSIVYIYLALAFMAIAKKTKTPNAWMAWIPILNVYLTIKIAGKPGWWFFLLCIPIVNFIISIIIWMSLAERCGKPNWMGLLIFLPFVNLVLPGLLAWSKDTPTTPIQKKIIK